VRDLFHAMGDETNCFWRLRNPGFFLTRRDAIHQVDRPAAGVAVHPHGDFGSSGGMIRWIVQHNEIGAELPDGQNLAVYVQLHAHNG